MTHVTHLLGPVEQGDPHAASRLLPLVYDELPKLAAQRLAHEAREQTPCPEAVTARKPLCSFTDTIFTRIS